MNVAQRNWTQASLLSLAFIPVFLIALWFDTRLLNDISIWIKPIKFHLATFVHLFTFAIVLRFLESQQSGARWIAIMAFISAGASIFELALIDFQATRAVASHFNNSSNFDGVIYALMGVNALLLTLPAPVLGAVFLLSKQATQIPLGIKLGVGWGLLLGGVFTFIIAGYMSMQKGHWVGESVSDASGIVFTGWSNDVGDLRVPHFFATHMMQLLPLFGWLVDKHVIASRALVKSIMLLAVFILNALTFTLFYQALAGRPLISVFFSF